MVSQSIGAEMSTGKTLSDSVVKRLRDHEKLQEATYRLTHRLFHSRDGEIFAFDLLIIAALKRSVALQSGFRQMIAARNMICAGSILRLQLDTTIRMHGAWIVDDADDFAARVLRHEQIRNIRDSKHQKMTDRYLVESLSKEYHWIPTLYETCCDYVHLSHVHISSAFDGADVKNAIAHVKISPEDRDLPDSHYLGAVADSMSCTKILHELVEARIDQRETTPRVGGHEP